MTDKQIIIDGVPVQDCKFYTLQEHYDMESDGLWKVCYSNDCKYSICANNPNYYYKQLKRAEQKLAKIKEVLEPIKCKHPEDCWENKPDWNGEVYGCEPDDMDNIASCPSKVATSVLQIIEGKDNGI